MQEAEGATQRISCVADFFIKPVESAQPDALVAAAVNIIKRSTGPERTDLQKRAEETRAWVAPLNAMLGRRPPPASHALSLIRL